jgi:hypothetical protein
MRTDRHDEATSRLLTRLIKIIKTLHFADNISPRLQAEIKRIIRLGPTGGVTPSNFKYNM